MARRRITWSPEAKYDLAYIFQYIKLDNPESARKVVDELRKLVRSLPDFPEQGRMVPEFGLPEIRERIHRGYRLVYRLREDSHIEVLQIFHSRRPDSEFFKLEDGDSDQL